MDSPDKSQRIIVSDVQESPFYKYLCDLSPIKPARRVHVAQTYSELSLPPPPAVFSSPPPNSRKSASRLRSGYGLAKTSGASAAETGWDDKNRPPSPGTFNGKPSDANADSLYTRHPRGYVPSSRPPPDQSHGPLNNGAGATGFMGSPSRAEAGDVELYLADPADGGLYAVRSSEMRNRTSSASALTSTLPIGSSSEDGDKCRRKGMVSAATEGLEKQDGHDDLHNDGASEANDDACGSQRFHARTSEELSLMLDELAARHADETTSSEVMTLGQSPGPGAIVCAVADSGASGAGVSMAVGDEASDFSFLTGAHDGESRTKLVHTWSEDGADIVVSRLPQRRTSVFPSNSSDPEATQEHEQKMQMQVSDFVASNSKLPLEAFQDGMSHEGMRYGNLPQDKEQVQQQQVQTNCRVAVTGQRGIRRRCLDFEAAEARRKSMGSSASRKCINSRAREVASGASYLASGASIPPQVLSDRAGSQSDATNSGLCSPHETDIQAHGPGAGRMDLQVSNKVTSGMMRMSRCSSSKSKEEKSIVEPLRDALNSPMSISIPSGIGLHLNSLAGSSVSFSPSRGFNCSMGMSTASLLGLTPMSSLREDSTDTYDQSLTTPGVSGGSMSLVSSAAFASASCLSVVEITREEQQDLKVNEASIVGNLKSTTCFRSLTLGVKSVQSRYSLEEGTERRGSPKRLLPHQELLRPADLDLSDEFFESPRSPKKRRKSAAVGEKASEGCRRCNCKKSKCLKLYCECFAAGIYCVGSCTCQDCFNKPEYGDKVLETRQLIESRNPLAFAPKIVHGKDTSPTSAEEFTDTPASARHKRGCNCKKSLCLKKYCECFQAGVGCSEGCRCEGCQNVYGKKEAFSEEQEEHMSQEGRDESEVQENHSLGRQPRSSSRVRAAAAKKKGLKEVAAAAAAAAAVGTPLPLKSRSPVKPPRLSRSSNPRSSAGSVRSLGLCPSQQQQMSRPSPQMPMSSPSHVSTPVAKSRIAMLSPRWDGLDDICTLTPLPQPPLRPTPASVSTLDNRCGASPSFNRQCPELASSYSGSGASGIEESSPALKHPDFQSSPAARCASNVTTASASHFQSPHPQTSPVSIHPTPPTPSLSSSQNTSLAGKTFSDAGVVPAYLSFDSTEDLDTPEILRYSDVPQSPQVLTKTSSPKQIKRVSPPHYDGMGKQSERGSGPGSASRNRVMSPGPSNTAGGTGSGSPGLSSGRKYILQALPSFPSMTPFSSIRGGHFNSG